jgi:hypothetical protein
MGSMMLTIRFAFAVGQAGLNSTDMEAMDVERSDIPGITLLEVPAAL